MFELARATHLTALWPQGYERGSEKHICGRGLAIELTLGGELEAGDRLAHPQLAVVVASLR